jgi:hypothetical protein
MPEPNARALNADELKEKLLNAQSYNELHQLINANQRTLKSILQTSPTDEFKNAFEAKCKALITEDRPKPVNSPDEPGLTPRSEPPTIQAPHPQPNRVEALELYKIVALQKTQSEALVAYKAIENLPPAPTPAPRPPTPFDQTSP